MIPGLEVLPYDDYLSIIRGLELIRITKMKDRDNLSNVKSFGFDEHGFNLKVFCTNGSSFYLAIAYVDYFFNEYRFAKTFGIEAPKLEGPHDLDD